MLCPSAWTPAQQQRLRAQAAQPAFAPVLATATAALDRAPRPLPSIVYEGRISSHPERVRHNGHLQDLGALRCLVLAHVATGEARFRDRALVYAQAWMDTYLPTGNAINDNKLAHAIGAWGFLRTDVAADARARGDAWVRRLAEAQIASSRDPKAPRSNWQSKRIRLVAAAGLALGDDALWRWAEEAFPAYIDVELHADGSSNDFRGRDALSYHCSGLTPLLELAQIAHDRGADWYHRTGRQGGSLEKSVAFLVTWIGGDKRHPEWVNTTVQLDRDRAKSGDPHYQPGRLFEPIEGLPTLRLAAPLDPALLPLIARIRGAAEETWQDVVQDARSAR